MAEHGEAAEPLRDLVLQHLDVIVLELEDEAALHADQVIVMIADDLVARLAVAELALDRETAVDEQLERAVDGRVADARLALANFREELVDRDVIARAQELLDDRLALRRHVEPAILDIGPPPLLELAGIVGTEVRAVLPHVRSASPQLPDASSDLVRVTFQFLPAMVRAWRMQSPDSTRSSRGCARSCRSSN